MNRILRLLLLTAALAALFCVPAFAAGSGFSDVKSERDDVKVTAQTADKKSVTQKTDGVYPDTVRIGLTYSKATSGKNYLVIATKTETAAPTEADIVYIDQVTANNGTVSFNIYPSELKGGATYYIYLSSDDGALAWTKAASYSYYRSYELGKINDDDVIDSDDAMLALKIFVGSATATPTQLAAADVTGDDVVDSDDAMDILKYFVGSISTFKAAG